MAETADALRLVADYRTVCDGFAGAIHAVRDQWDAPTPAAEGNTGEVVEHVLGNNESLLLGPLGALPDSLPEDPEARWAAIRDALFPALERPGVVEPRELLFAILTSDVLIHTWDLYRAVGTDLTLDPRICQVGLDQARVHLRLLEESGALQPAVAVPEDAPVQRRLLGFFGRDPDWCCPAS